MMTTMCALMGTLPIALSQGAGAESRRPLGITVVGGLAFSQLITLFITPVVYVYMDRVNRWLGTRFGRKVVDGDPSHGRGEQAGVPAAAMDGSPRLA
jgi:HAE1 family hydrophobic/amphiphilic exporter-1